MGAGTSFVYLYKWFVIDLQQPQQMADISSNLYKSLSEAVDVVGGEAAAAAADDDVAGVGNKWCLNYGN